MGPYLLDANVLVALLWPTHTLHGRATRWFASRRHLGWATCPFTQAAVIRILSNPSFSPNALTATDALHLVEANLAHPNHQFWGDSIPVVNAIRQAGWRLAGHQQVTDAYLVGLAVHRKGKLATMDQRILTHGKAAVELIA